MPPPARGCVCGAPRGEPRPGGRCHLRTWYTCPGLVPPVQINARRLRTRAQHASPHQAQEGLSAPASSPPPLSNYRPPPLPAPPLARRLLSPTRRERCPERLLTQQAALPLRRTLLAPCCPCPTCSASMAVCLSARGAQHLHGTAQSSAVLAEQSCVTAAPGCCQRVEMHGSLRPIPNHRFPRALKTHYASALAAAVPQVGQGCVRLPYW